MRRLSTHAATIGKSSTTPRFPKTASTKQSQLSSVGSLRLASVDDASSPVQALSLAVLAGPRFHSNGHQTAGAAQFIRSHAFHSTNTRSVIRITREADILGSVLSSTLSRELLLLSVNSSRDDL